MNTDDLVVIGLEKNIWDDASPDFTPEEARLAPGVRSVDLSTIQDGITLVTGIGANLVTIIVARPHLAKLARRVTGCLKQTKTGQITLSLKRDGKTVNARAVNAGEDEILNALLDILQQMDSHDAE